MFAIQNCSTDMKKFEFEYPWTSRTEWMLPDGEEMMQNQFPILDEQIDFVLNTTHEYLKTRVGLGQVCQRTCVQAGGAFGMYPLRLCDHFDKVWTFEPLMENLLCLKENVTGTKNLVVAPSALWHEEARLWMDYSKAVKNSYGAHHVSRSRTNGELVEAEPLDAYGEMMDQLDLLWLDVEGSEVYALMGAAGTIRRTKPVIVIEERYLPQMGKLDVRPDSASNWLTRNGYKCVGRTHGDTVWIPR